MSKDHQAIAINDAVHEIQLALLNGVTTSQNHLFLAGTLMSQSDYEDVVTERTIAKLCGYPLCRASLPSDVYCVSLKEHKVYDVQETRKFCSGECLVSSQAFAKTLQEVRTSEFDMVKLSVILGLFGDGDENVEEEGLGLGKLTIHENSDVRGGEVDEMGVMSDGYSVDSVSKQPPCSVEDPLSSHLEGSQALDKKNALLGSSSGSNTKGLRKKTKKMRKKVTSGEYNIADSCEGLKAHQDMCSSSESVTKSCLKVPGSKKLGHSVTWADQIFMEQSDLCLDGCA